MLSWTRLALVLALVFVNLLYHGLDHADQTVTNKDKFLFPATLSFAIAFI